MANHTIRLNKGDTNVDLFTNAIPPIPVGTKCYIQNVSNTDVRICEFNNTNMQGSLVITSVGTATSVFEVEGGDSAYLEPDGGAAELSVWT